ncbi:MAG: GNAT family N-acetyltransferase [Bacteroidetes bacterium]|nr:GNAT family N-acetyltransferase [Bacteroidota bacterium]
MNFEVRVHSFHENYIANLIPLYKSAFGFEVKLAYIRSKFFSSYQKLRLSKVAISDSGEAVSFYGIISQKAIYKNMEFYIGQSCDSMTHKNFGGQGLFLRLAESAYKDAYSQGVSFIYGFPNKTIYGLRIKKLNWQHKENINNYAQKVSAVPLAKAVKKMPFLKSLYNSYLSALLRKYRSEVSFFGNSVLTSDIAGVIHDHSYFTYKSSADKYIIKICGINFWIKFDGLLWVGDFENTDQENFMKALQVLKKIAKRAGCTSIHFHYQEGTANDFLLKQILPLKGQMPYGYLFLSQEYSDISFKFSAADFDTW